VETTKKQHCSTAGAPLHWHLLHTVVRPEANLREQGKSPCAAS
jgi:hypothetical protein